MQFKITVTPTNNEHIVKFEANTFITKNESFEHNNIDEAKNSPLAQQLSIYLCKKGIYLWKFYCVERFNIVSWNDVQSEVAEQIENYLNEGGEVVNSEAVSKKVPVTVYAESTPNPGVMKFVANKNWFQNIMNSLLLKRLNIHH